MVGMGEIGLYRTSSYDPASNVPGLDYVNDYLK